ncbi:molybdopterin molybdotransferase MoeA, partial [Verrucomicrobiota bacterium]
DENTVRFTEKDTSVNICIQGEDIKAGDVVMRKGEIIHPQHIGLLATVGCASPLVGRQPVVGVIATGSELVEPGEKPGTSQIRNSNSYQLCAQVTRAVCVAEYNGIAVDTEEATDKAIKDAMSKSDVILLSGGVSMGDFDFVPEILRDNGFDLLFEKIAVKPGMPTVFGCSEKCFCFGLPGNPVSTFVVFELLAKPFLLKLMGHDFEPFVVPIRLDKTIVRKKIKRDSWVPVRRCETGGVEALEYHGPAHLNCLSNSIGMICVPRGMSEVKEGAIVDVRQI